MNLIALLGLLFDGAQVLVENLKMILIFSIQIFGIGVLTSWGISNSRANGQHTHWVAFLNLGLCGFVLLSYAIVAISRVWHAALPILAMGMLTVSSLVVLIRFLVFIKKKERSGRFTDLIIPIAVIALILLVRFAFLKELEYPLYYDSAVHYQIIDDLQSLSQSQQSGYEMGALNSGRYYHLGFHSTVVVLAAQLRDSHDEAQLILVTGHVFLMLLILNVGTFASRLFNNSYAGISTILFAGLGWAMPAFAVNWGKYPAIASLAVFSLALYWMIDSFHPPDKNRRLPILLYSISALCAILLHSRSLVLLVCGVVTMVTLHVIWTRCSRDQIHVLFWAEIGLLLLIARLHPNVQEAILPYVQGIEFIVTLLAIVFLFFVVRHNLKIATGILTFLLSVAVASIIPMPAVLSSQIGPYLFDRPFLQISLFAPLACFAGGGFSYLIRAWLSHISRPALASPIIGMGLLSLTVLAILLRPVSDFKPSPCCVYMTIDDIFLIGWMNDNIPPNSRILVATDTEINTPFVKVNIDAGAWIPPLTELETIKFDYRTDFSDATFHNTLCQENIKYIYVSAVNQGFSIFLLEENKQKYSPILVLPDARLYGVNCQLG
jgi:hypothetical protein